MLAIVVTGIQSDLMKVNLLHVGSYGVNISFFIDNSHSNISSVLWAREIDVTGCNNDQLCVPHFLLGGGVSKPFVGFAL